MNKTSWGLTSIYLLVGLPLIIWLTMSSPINRWNGFSQSATSLAQLSGLSGIVLFAVTIVLSARPRFLENYFGGLNQMYVIHHKLGELSLVLLLFHPIFSATKLIPISLTAATTSVMPGINWPINFGWLSLGLLITLLILTLYLRPRYNIWKWFHRWMGLALGFAGLHAFLIHTDKTGNIIRQETVNDEQNWNSWDQDTDDQ